MSKTITTILFLILSLHLSAQWNVTSFSESGSYITKNNGDLYVTTYEKGVYKTNNLIDWDFISNGLPLSPFPNMEFAPVYMLLAEGDTLFAATREGIYKSINGGQNWIKKSNGIVIGGGGTWEFTQSIFRADDGVLFTGSYTGIYRSTDDGENWISTNITDNYVGNFIEHNGILFAGRSAGNSPYGYKSIDNGHTWEVLSFPFPVDTYFSEGNNLFICGLGASISTDNGSTWTLINEGLNADPNSFDIVKIENTLLTTDNSGVSRSFNNGENWELFSDGLPLRDFNEIIAFNDKLVTVGAGVWQRDLSQVLNIDDNYITDFSFNIYPNPSKSFTTFSFTLKQTSDVEINIYNFKGQKVSSVIKKQLTSGINNIQWNRNKEYLNSGIYLCELIINNTKTDVLKLILE